ncbi:spindle and kinetochore-associated protein 2 isoform X4 [Mustela putorius furo]|uniref:Spindle and kinetochore-associated protein 2 isoform X4 n=1 Tax=Mustela putorius furo TaxID=9669 RepID=A0A8U0RN00_MUSPF|nr:spindle and kinetochore-associated protein 2 isoform X4 [Mustela putorius furo]
MEAEVDKLELMCCFLQAEPWVTSTSALVVILEETEYHTHPHSHLQKISRKLTLIWITFNTGWNMKSRLIILLQQARSTNQFGPVILPNDCPQDSSESIYFSCHH